MTSRLNLALQTLEDAASSDNPASIFCDPEDDVPNRFVTTFKLGTASNPAGQIEQKLSALVRKADRLIKAEFAPEPKGTVFLGGERLETDGKARSHYEAHKLGYSTFMHLPATPMMMDTEQMKEEDSHDKRNHLQDISVVNASKKWVATLGRRLGNGKRL